MVVSDDPEKDVMPLKSTRADVKIAGMVAEVKITQVYRNTGKKTLEAIYVFPGSTRAAVHAMRMTIGERVIEAEIMERQKARETYETAKKAGKTTSLLEQQRPNVFQMNVANILPNGNEQGDVGVLFEQPSLCLDVVGPNRAYIARSVAEGPCPDSVVMSIMVSPLDWTLMFSNSIVTRQ